MKIELTENEFAALVILKSTGIPVIEAAQVACAALKAGRGRVKRALKCLEMGVETLRQQEQTVTFEKAVAVALEARRDRRIRTVYDFRYFTRRFMKRCPGLGKRKVRAITSQECAKYIEMAFDTPRQRQKARLILSGVFGTALKQGWCRNNPVSQVAVPRIVETPITILSAEEVKDLWLAARDYNSGSCNVAVGMMLYAGIRPHEVARLTWNQVDIQERAIYILPRHSKTGGARRVTIHYPLLSILREYQCSASEKICPPGWVNHWKKLRQAAGWKGDKRWQQDVLRHTFASYHLSYFRSYDLLQVEIGHRDTALLRTRYLDQRGVQSVDRFWTELPG